ncbi:hypothetical protein M885DRAFT_548377 [Pelagophyceae sp. CCMP2097]|nr:hypothetical protein M885DRAFT_548377 [Pelagophyceae sp. CCMP2097]
MAELVDKGVPAGGVAEAAETVAPAVAPASAPADAADDDAEEGDDDDLAYDDVQATEELVKRFGFSEGYMCDGCGGAIMGRRWHCDQCDEFDYCAACHATFVKCVADGEASPDAQYGHEVSHTMSPAADENAGDAADPAEVAE